MQASSTGSFAERSLMVMLLWSNKHLGPARQQIAEMTAKMKQYDRKIQLLTPTKYLEA
jgi:hypothetical protein